MINLVNQVTGNSMQVYFSLHLLPNYLPRKLHCNIAIAFPKVIRFYRNRARASFERLTIIDFPLFQYRPSSFPVIRSIDWHQTSYGTTKFEFELRNAAKSTPRWKTIVASIEFSTTQLSAPIPLAITPPESRAGPGDGVIID